MEQGLQPLWRNDSQQVTSPPTTTLAADIPAHLNRPKRCQKNIDIVGNYGARVLTLAANMLLPRLLKCVAVLILLAVSSPGKIFVSAPGFSEVLRLASGTHFKRAKNQDKRKSWKCLDISAIMINFVANLRHNSALLSLSC